ncbi:MAG: flagellar filament capping protein FliD [Burkholderiales bacterium]|nr:flagellar filament capping protein FliD [Burkholderiales bacterium]
MHTQMAYNADSKTGGSLQGDQTAVQLQRTLREALNMASTASTTFKTMSDIGITMKADGTLETSATKLDNSLGNLTELKKLLSADGALPEDIGFARRWKNLADAALGSEGAFESRNASLSARLAVNTKAQDAMSQRLAQTESRLRAQYNALDTKMAQLNGLSGYLTQQLTAMNKSSNG